MTKKILCILVIFILIIGTLLLSSRYGWRFFGFRYCTNPSIIHVESVAVNKGYYQIKGSITDSMSAFIGYTSKIDGENIYIGLKYNTFLGFLDRNGKFDIKIDRPMPEQIYNIYIVNEQYQTLIWPIESTK